MSQYDPNCACAACNVRKRQSEKELQAIIDFHKKIIENQQDLPPEFSKAVDKHFWELV